MASLVAERFKIQTRQHLVFTSSFIFYWAPKTHSDCQSIAGVEWVVLTFDLNVFSLSAPWSNQLLSFQCKDFLFSFHPCHLKVVNANTFCCTQTSQWKREAPKEEWNVLKPWKISELWFLSCWLLTFIQAMKLTLKVVFARHFLLSITPLFYILHSPRIDDLYQLPFSVVYIFETPYRRIPDFSLH